MKAGDKVTIKNHAELKGEHTVEEYIIKGRTFFHVKKVPLTSDESEPWDIICLIRSESGGNHYEATWRRQPITRQYIEEL